MATSRKLSFSSDQGHASRRDRPRLICDGMTLRWVAEAGATLVVSVALGHALEALAYRQYFGLHWVPLGPGGGVDPVAAEKRPRKKSQLQLKKH